MRNPPVYVLITPARDEEAFIEATLASVTNQTLKPLKWIIVSDGSTDSTDEIVGRYMARCPWIELIQVPRREERHFGGKVEAFNAGYARVKHLDYDVIGNLDGDVILEPDYFAFLIPKFADHLELGVAGTPFRERSFQYDFRFTSTQHVSGQCQMFRRACFEEIGGYVPRKIGGIDLVAVTTARMKGWHTKTFIEKPYIHQRRMGTATASLWTTPLKYGVTDYVLGCHPLWQGARCVYQMSRPPLVIGGVLRMSGFVWAWLRRAEKQVSPDFVRFRRAEQMSRLRMLLGLR